MNEPDQSAELQQLRAQLAELTRRVYFLEGLLSARAEPENVAPSSSAPLAPPAPSDAEAESRFQPQIASSPLIPTTPPTDQIIAVPGSSQNAAVQPSATPAKAKSNASLESVIGGQWLNRIGIVAVLIGLSYFLKLAFENAWIGPATQVIIGLVAGAGILFWSESFRRRNYPAFAYSLKAVGIGALYLSLWATSQYYHLVPPMVTFFGMVVVTIITAALSLRQNAELLAAFAILGGFLTPVLVSTGQNHEIALFCYIALLDLGVLWITSGRGWRRLLLGSYAGTALLFGAWASTYYNEAQLTPTLAFATFFFLLFVAAPFLGSNFRASEKQPSVMLPLILLNAAGYFAAIYLVLDQHFRAELAALTAFVAVLFFALSRFAQRKSLAADSPIYLAIAVGYCSVALALKFNGPALALGWLVEAGTLFWASHRGAHQLLRWLGVVALSLGVLRLLADSDVRQPLILNPRFGLYLVAIGTLALLAYFASSEGGDENRTWASAAVLALNVLALVALHFEVVDYFRYEPLHRYSSADWRSMNIMRDFTYSAIWMIYGSVLMVVGFWKRSAFLRWQAIVLLVLTTAKVFFYDIAALERGYRIVAFMVLGAVLLAVSFFYQRSRMKSAE